MNLRPIPSHKRFRISELCELTKGSFPTLRTQPGDFPLVVTADFRRSADGWDIAGPAVCIPLISSTGHGDAAINRVHYQEGKFALANLLVALTPKKDAPVVAKYLYFLLGAQKDKLLVPLMMGTANVSLKPKDIAEVEIELPTIEIQKRIIERIDKVQLQLQAVDKLRVSIDRDIASLLSVRFQETLTHAKWLPMSEVAPIVRRDITVDDQSKYAELGIRSFGKGTFHKPTLSGLELGEKRVYRIEPGDLLFSNVFAWEGAIAVTQPEDAGRVGSHRFISCVPHDGLTTAEYLRYYFLTDEGMTKIRDASPGGAGRNRTLGLSKLMDLNVPIPSIEVREAFIDLLRLLNASRLIRSQQLIENESVVPALVNRLMANSEIAE